MKAVGYTHSLPIEDHRSLFDFEAAKPVPLPRDLLIKVEAIAVNPLDAVQRKRKESQDGAPIILGWDIAGSVEATGAEVAGFDVGDAVFLSGDLQRPGGNAEYMLADERVVARKPESLSFAEAAALPLTSITAWEAIFDRLRVPVLPTKGEGSILLIGAAGGVGSMAVQFLKALTSFNVVATASRPESKKWLESLGADLVLDHTRSLSAQLRDKGIAEVPFVFPLSHTLEHWDEIIACLAPEGEVVVVDDPSGIDIAKLRPKAGGLHFEMMWVKVIYGNEKKSAIGDILTRVSGLVEAGKIKGTAAQNFGAINAGNLRRAHAAIEGGRTIGKIVLSGF